MQAWPAGHYRLDVVIEPGRLIHRTVEVVVERGPAAIGRRPSTASAATPAS